MWEGERAKAESLSSRARLVPPFGCAPQPSMTSRDLGVKTSEIGRRGRFSRIPTYRASTVKIRVHHAVEPTMRRVRSWRGGWAWPTRGGRRALGGGWRSDSGLSSICLRVLGGTTKRGTRRQDRQVLTNGQPSALSSALPSAAACPQGPSSVSTQGRPVMKEQAGARGSPLGESMVYCCSSYITGEAKLRRAAQRKPFSA